ncbi:MFS transporter [Bacillus cereus group sp. BfR-BA-01380]|uniref:MFS transporter n=1 Tax=Bacillus cereus group sp. BfR-BA-01380 TaxID=2920324 RepID=UPI001F566C48|nr:MFS transporter [Bacillus cereus group sp. BfR-BA-01380]
MSSLYRDSRLYFILGANSLSAIGSGITMITISWLLVTAPGGNTMFGYISIMSTLVMFLCTPFIGHCIDRFSRKTLLLVNEAIGAIAALAMVCWGFTGHSYETIHYIVLYITGSFYYLVFYPNIFAFNQEVFAPEHYKSLSGTMEIQGQLTQVIAGAVASLMIAIVDVKWILLINMISYVGAFILLSFIPYTKQRTKVGKQPFVKQIFEGVHFMKQRKRLFWFLFATYMPFIGVMMTNYLMPVYISDVLKANGSVYGTEGMMYGIGAMLAGIGIPILMKYVKTEVSIVFTMLIYTISITVMIIQPSVYLLYGLAIFKAMGNAGTRVARSVLMMEEVPNEIIGRVDSLFRFVGTGVRVILLIAFTTFVSQIGVMVPFYALSLLLISATCIAFLYVKMQRQERIHITNKTVV